MKKLMMIAVLLATRFLAANADADPKFYIFICFGQSNMEGNAQPEEIDRQGVDKRFRLLTTCEFTSNPTRRQGYWYTATPPLVSPNGGLGSSDYFGRTLLENLPEDYRVGVVPVAMGGSPIEMFDKDLYQQKINEKPSEWYVTLANDFYGGNPYGRIIEMAKKAQKAGVIKGILLHQGCSNNGDPNWPNMVKKIYNDMLTDLGLSADTVPLFVGETLYENQGGSCYAHNTQVALMPSVVPTSHVVSAEYCPGNGNDPWHFNAFGYRVLGTRYAYEAMKVLGIEPNYFLFHNYTFVNGNNASFDATTRTITLTGSGMCSWTFPSFADWSAYKYLVVKLKEPQTVDAEVFLYGKTKNISYRDTIRDRTVMVMDLQNLKQGNSVMDPSKVYKMSIRGLKAGTIALDTVFLSNDNQYDVTGIRTVSMASDNTDDAIYDLRGHRVNADALKPGIYIHKGKKIVR